MDFEEESRLNFISCVKWVRRGVANTNPERVQLSKQELVQIIKDTQNKLNVTNEGEGTSANTDEFNMENYDNDDDNAAATTLGIASLTELPTEELENNFSESDDSEKEDDLIKPSDNLILVGHVDGDASILEVYVYNEEEESLYVHHDILLPAFPLCLEWLNYEPNSPRGNYCAVGTMAPIIEVWDLDIVNCLEPAFTLGQISSRKKNRPNKGHKDAVLSLAWNKTYEHVLASGSVDKSIILWDMENGTPTTTIKAFGDKIQCLEWHLLEAQTLLAGACDKLVKIFDCRTPDPHQTWEVDGEVERLCWNPQKPFQFLSATSTGSVQCFDCRRGQLWSISAHEKEVTGLTISGQCPGLLITSSPDNTIKIWDITDNNAKFVGEKNFSIGAVHCLELCPDSPFVIAAGGDNKSNNLLVYDLQNFDVVKNNFESRELIQLVAENNGQTSN